MAVKSFTIEEFAAGDVINLVTAVSKLETVSGGIKAGNVTIGGIIYQSAMVAGAKVSDKKITYDTASGKSDLFTIDGLSSKVGFSLADMEVTLTEAALANRTSDIITISDGNIEGGTGRNTLYGTSGNDYSDGGNGNDVISGSTLKKQ